MATSKPAHLRVVPAPGSGGTEVWRELLDQLAGLHTALQSLVALATDKLAALRRADVPVLENCAARESELLTALARGEPQRKAVLARVAQALPGGGDGAPRLSAVAERLPEPWRSALRARNVALQEIAAELQQKNRLAARVAQNLHSHIRGIFAELAGAAQESAVYGPQGKHETGAPRCWVDAVG